VLKKCLTRWGKVVFQLAKERIELKTSQAFHLYWLVNRQYDDTNPLIPDHVLHHIPGGMQRIEDLCTCFKQTVNLFVVNDCSGIENLRDAISMFETKTNINPFWSPFSCIYNDLREREVAAFTIQFYWREVICNPTYTMCKRRLRKEFEETLLIL